MQPAKISKSSVKALSKLYKQLISSSLSFSNSLKPSDNMQIYCIQLSSLYSIKFITKQPTSTTITTTKKLSWFVLRRSTLTHRVSTLSNSFRQTFPCARRASWLVQFNNRVGLVAYSLPSRKATLAFCSHNYKPNPTENHLLSWYSCL